MVYTSTMRDVERRLKCHRQRVAKLKPLQGLSDDDCRTPVWHEIHIVGVRHHHHAVRPTGFGVDRHKLSVNAMTLCAARYPKGFQVPRWNNMLRSTAGLEPIHNLKRSRINYVHILRHDIGNIDSR